MSSEQSKPKLSRFLILLLPLAVFSLMGRASPVDVRDAPFPSVPAEDKGPIATADTPGQACPVPPPASAPSSAMPSNALPFRPFPVTWQAVLDKFVADNVVPGAVVIVKSPSWGVRVGTAGFANIANRTKPGPEEQFRVGSVTKVFTAQTILQLEQEGLLKLTDPVLKFLSGDAIVRAIPNIEKVTVADLLQMKSGITSYTTDKLSIAVRTDPSKSYTPDDLMAILGPNATPVLSPDFTPGETYPDPYWFELYKVLKVPKPSNYPYWYYSNSNYILLGMIIQKVTRMPAVSAIQRYVMNKLGLKDTFLATDAKYIPAMRGYTQYDALNQNKIYTDWCDVTATNPSYAWTAGAIISTPWDLLHLLESMFETQRMLNDGTKEKWLTFVSADIHLGWAPIDYGVGALMQPHRPYGDFRGHGGAYPGYKALIYYFYDARTSFVLATNTWDQSGESAPEVAMLDKLMPLVKSSVTTPHPENEGLVRVGPRGKAKLAWQTGRVYGDSFNVYLGKDANKVDVADAHSHSGTALVVTTENFTEIGNLAPGKTYYWRVDTIAKDVQITGPLWRFRTGSR
jgi:D-alanyl-D-alanine carboxypeptidase